MKIASAFRVACVLVVLVGGTSAAFAAAMTSDDYRTVRHRIEAEYKDTLAACAKFRDNARDVCREEAKGKEKVARAELEYNRSGSAKDATTLAITKVDAAYAVAKERCDDRSGRDKDVCVQQAKTEHVKALADARADSRINEARRAASDDKRDADYDLAKERCDALTGANKESCLNAAKARYGKT